MAFKALGMGLPLEVQSTRFDVAEKTTFEELTSVQLNSLRPENSVKPELSTLTVAIQEGCQVRRRCSDEAEKCSE
jgi:hypothetical protein